MTRAPLELTLEECPGTHGVGCRQKFRDQFRDAAASVARNIAEGFGRYTPGDFARFLRYARGSLAETRNCLKEARARGHLPDTLASRLLNLAAATDRATKNLMLTKLRQAAAARQQR